MSSLINIIIFLIVLFLYIHISNQYKKSEDLEIYEMDYTNNRHLQEVCYIKQPVLFNYKVINDEFFETMNLELLSKHGTNDIKIKDINDYWNPDSNNLDYVNLPFQSSQNLMTTDTNSKYFSENNNDFIEDSGIIKLFNENNSFLKPNFCATTKYDICLGSKNTVTPLRYHTNYRHFICVNSGKISIKLTPWKSRKYLNITEDYENFEFRSPINVWNPQKKFINDYDKIKFLEFDVQPGYMLYIPPYWFYSIKYSNSSENLICGFTYNSIMNCVANIPNYSLYFLQQHNTKTKITKTLDIEPEVKPEPITTL